MTPEETKLYRAAVAHNDCIAALDEAIRRSVWTASKWNEANKELEMLRATTQPYPESSMLLVERRKAERRVR